MKFRTLFILMSFFVGLVAHAEWTFDEKGLSDLHSAIDHLGERLYCCSELTGGGKNGEEFEEIIDEHVQKFKLLLQRPNPPVNHPDAQGRTPLMRAAFFHQYEIMKLLLDAGAEINITDKKGNRALEYLKIRGFPSFDSFDIVINVVMSRYYTKERYNNCVKLLTKNVIKQLWHKQWLSVEEKLRLIQKPMIRFILEKYYSYFNA